MKRRHVLAVLALSFVTLGIYVIYWLYKTRLELLPYLQDKKAIPRVIVLFIPAFAMIAALIPAAIFMASSWDAYAEEPSNAGTAVFLGVFIAGMLASAIVSFWWFYKYFQAVEAVVRGNSAMLMYSLWIALTLIGVGPIWTLIVQDDLNKFIDNDYRPLRTLPRHTAPAHEHHGHQPAHHEHHEN